MAPFSKDKLKEVSWWKSRVLSMDGLTRIRDHKYKGGEYTPLDNAMNGFWFKCAEAMPLWMAPNLITLVALLHTTFATVVMGYFMPNYETSAPWWAYLLTSICMFIYQTLDAVDGKQARRTGNSTPLGQLFDHGCDGFSTILIADGITMLTLTPDRALTNQVIFAVPFFLAQWEEMHTGTLRTCMLFMDGKMGIGVTETQIFQMFVFLLAAICGPGLYTYSVTESFTTGRIILNCLSVGLVGMCLMSLKYVWDVKGTNERRLEAMKQLATPLALSAVALCWTSPANIANPRVSSMNYGLGMGYCIVKMIIFSMAHMPFSTFQPVVFSVVLPYVLEMMLGGSYWLYIGFIANIIIFARFVCGAISEICEMLNINAFKVKDTKKNDGPSLAIPSKAAEKEPLLKSPTGTGC